MGGEGAKSSPKAKTIAQKTAEKNGSSVIKLTKKEKDIMFNYTDGASFDINRTLALGIKYPQPEELKVLDSVINRGEIPKGTKLYRGTIPEVLGIQKNIRDMTADDVNQLIGQTITNKAYISTSKSKEVANNYTGIYVIPEIRYKNGTVVPGSISPKGKVKMIITVKNSTKGFDTSKFSFFTTYSSFNDKQEVILPRGSQFRVTNAKRKSDNLTLYIEY